MTLSTGKDSTGTDTGPKTRTSPWELAVAPSGGTTGSSSIPRRGRLGALIGRVMKASEGRANPERVRATLLRLIQTPEAAP